MDPARSLSILLALALAACATSSAPGGDIDGNVDPTGDGGNDPTGDGGNDPTGDGGSDLPDGGPGAPDAAACVSSPCDLVPQCGCPSNQACDLDFSDLVGTACRGVATPGTEVNTCSAINQCAAGYVCLGGSGSSSCMRYCAGDGDCVGPRGQCAIQIVNSQNQPIDGATVCSSNCDPVAASHPLCPTGWTCDLFTAGARNIVDCRPAGPATQGQSCATTGCAANHSCINVGGSPQCLRLCALPAGTQCSAVPGSTCRRLGDAPGFVVAGQEYGACL
jgi:hypothetical protein